MDNFFEDLLKRIRGLEKKEVSIKCGTVTSVTPFKCKFDGEDVEIAYLRPHNYTPAINDRVYFIYASGKYVCLGKYV